MSVSHRYRNFGGVKKSASEQADATSELTEDLKLQAFEAGYQAGWDDATKAHTDGKEKVTAELGQNLLDMSFTYHEALAKLTVSLEPLMKQIVEKLLPETVRMALSAHILEQVNLMMKDQLSHPVEIVVHEKNIDMVKKIAGAKLTEPFTVVGESSLGEGQAFVRVGQSEQQVDLDAVITGVSDAMTAFFHESGQEIANE